MLLIFKVTMSQYSEEIPTTVYKVSFNCQCQDSGTNHSLLQKHYI